MNLFLKRTKPKLLVRLLAFFFRLVLSRFIDKLHVPYDRRGRTAIVRMDGSSSRLMAITHSTVEKIIGGTIVHYDSRWKSPQRDGITIGDVVLDDLMEILSEDPDVTRVIAVTDKPIVQSRDGETIVYGLANLSVPVCVVSSFLLAKDSARGFAKVVTHEILHTFGMEHCDDETCVMQAKVRNADVKTMPEVLCDSCENRIREKMRVVD